MTLDQKKSLLRAYRAQIADLQNKAAWLELEIQNTEVAAPKYASWQMCRTIPASD